MPVDLDKTRALLASVVGFTEGPWTMGKPALVDIALMADALRSIATIIGAPTNADPLTDLDGLVMAVRGLAERAETVRVVTADRDALVAEMGARIADAVAADRAAFGAWLRAQKDFNAADRLWLARAIEHGDHIEQDESITAEPAPPLPSLRLTLAANRMLLEKVATMEARLLTYTEATSPAGLGGTSGSMA